MALETPHIQIRRGLRAGVPASSILAGEQFFTTDRHSMHLGIDATTTVPVVPPIDELVTLASVDGTADLLIIHDASASGVMEKKITFDAFKDALNIPDGATDELVAVVDGGTSGFLMGTDTTDGVLRMAPSMQAEIDGGNGFVTIGVNVVDCGTF